MNAKHNTKKKAFFLLMAVFLGGMSGYTETASAASIGPNCVSCNGGTYSLTYSGTGPVFEITYIINTGLDASASFFDNAWLNSVGFKVSNSVSNVSLLEATGGVGSWNLFTGGVNASGCSGSGSGFECAEWSVANGGLATGDNPLHNTLSNNGLFKFVFQLTTSNLLLGVNEASVKALFVDSTGTKTGAVVSEGITLTPTTSTCTTNCGGGGGGQGSVPEPSVVALLGMGLLGMGLSRKTKA